MGPNGRAGGSWYRSSEKFQDIGNLLDCLSFPDHWLCLRADPVRGFTTQAGETTRRMIENKMGERVAPKAKIGRTDDPQEISDAVQPGKASPVGRMEAELQDHIGRELRALYNEIVQEPIPERFLKLLDDLERKQTPTS